MSAGNLKWAFFTYAIKAKAVISTIERFGEVRFTASC